MEVFDLHMEIEDLLDAEKIFDKCDWSNRKDIGEKLAEYIKKISQILWGQILSSEKIVKIATQLSEAILEDIEVHDYTLNIWNENMRANKCTGAYNSREKEKLEGFIDRMFPITDDKSQHGLAKYTMRYGGKDPIKLEKGIKSDKKYLDDFVGRELYKKIYPVFWLEMLNRNRKGETDDAECLIEPIRLETEKEQYLFALLLDERTVDISENTIFSGIQRLYTARYKRAKKAVNKYDMQKAEDRLHFVRWMKKCLLDENKKGNMNKTVFTNNLVTMREIIELGKDDNIIDIPAFIFLLDRLTGWIEFYNFVSLRDEMGGKFHISVNEEKDRLIQDDLKKTYEMIDSLLDMITECTDTDELEELVCEAAKCIYYRDDLEYELTSNDNAEPDYADFEEVIEFTHIAFLYVWGKIVREDEGLMREHHGILGKRFMESMSRAYEQIYSKRQYVKNDADLSSKWYESLYNELFVDDISNVNKATKMDALDFYDVYITYTK